METGGYAVLSRQTGLMREIQIVANNVANAATTGYREEGLLFSEFVERDPGNPALSMTRASTRSTSLEQGGLTKTGGTFDLAIEGDGFFLVETDRGPRLTRAGTFVPSAEGELVTASGQRVLDDGGGPVFVPPGGAAIQIAADGTISADGQPIGRIGVYQPINPNGLVREDGVLFHAEAGTEPIENPKVLQGFLEDSNVNPVTQIARMIEVQRAYEMGQKLLESEDERIRAAVKALLR